MAMAMPTFREPNSAASVNRSRRSFVTRRAGYPSRRYRGHHKRRRQRNSRRQPTHECDGCIDNDEEEDDGGADEGQRTQGRAEFSAKPDVIGVSTSPVRLGDPTRQRACPMSVESGAENANGCRNEISKALPTSGIVTLAATHERPVSDRQGRRGPRKVGERIEMPPIGHAAISNRLAATAGPG